MIAMQKVIVIGTEVLMAMKMRMARTVWKLARKIFKEAQSRKSSKFLKTRDARTGIVSGKFLRFNRHGHFKRS